MGPETNGKDRAAGGVGAWSSREIEVSENPGARPPDFTTPDAHDVYSIPIEASYGLWEAVDFGLVLNPLESGGGLRLKIQLLGDSAAKAKSGLSLGIYGQGIYTSTEKEGDQKDLFGPGGFPYNAKASILAGQYGASIGLRLRPLLMIYVGGAIGTYDGDIKVVQSAATDNSDPGGTYTAEIKGDAKSAGLGLVIGEKNRFEINAAYAEAEFDGLSKYSEVNVNGSIFGYF